jgi:hypothetical protein
LWTAVQGPTPGSAGTVSVTFGGAFNGWHFIVVERWTNAKLATSPVVSAVQGQTSALGTLATSQADSVISWLDVDYNAVNPNSGVTYRSATAVTPSTPDYHLGDYTGYSGYIAAPAQNTYTYGVSAPSGQKATMIGIEIQVGTLVLRPSGIPSGYVSGSNVVQREPAKQIAPSGIPTGYVRGATQVKPGAVSIQPVGIAPKPNSFGTARIVPGVLLFPHGIPSATQFGSSQVVPGPVNLLAHGLISRYASGFTQVKRVVVAVASAADTKPQNQVKYEMVCVARIPQPQSPPLFFDVDPISWTGLSYTQQLNGADYLTAGVSVSSLTSPILQRLDKLGQQATEIWLYRNGQLVFTGPWFGWQVQGETLTLTAKSTLGYLDMMMVNADMVLKNKDQFAIGKALVDQWQALDYGNFGIDTSGITQSGVLRDATYLRNELNIVGQRLSELGKRDNGFDFGVDPITRRLNFYYPQRGVDRSTGEDAVIFDARNVTNTNVICSAAPKDLASEAYGVGTSAGSTSGALFSLKSNLDMRAQYGRTAVGTSFNDVSEQDTLDSHTQALVDARSEPLLIPGPNVRVTPDSDISSYDVGDTVAYQLHAKLGVTGYYRLKSRQITVSDKGKEDVTPTFV